MNKPVLAVACTALFLTACAGGEKEPMTWKRDLGSSQVETVNKNIPLIEKQLEDPKKTTKTIKPTSKK